MNNRQREDVLHLYCSSRRLAAVEIVREKLGKGADPRKKSDEGLTPLHVAAAYDNLAIAQLLMHYGADPLAKDDHGRTPFSMATGATKLFFERHLKRDRRMRRGILRRFFLCYSVPMQSLHSTPSHSSILQGFRNRLRKSVANVIGLKVETVVPIKDVPLPLLARPRRCDQSSDKITAPPTTPRRRARTPEGRLEKTPKPQLRVRSKTPDPLPSNSGTPQTPSVPTRPGAKQRTKATAVSTPTNNLVMTVRKKKTPTAPPQTPDSVRSQRGRAATFPANESQEYHTADESLDVDQLLDKFNQLNLVTPSSSRAPDEAILSQVRKLKEPELRIALRKHGVHAGPICSKTRKMYEKKLATLMSGQELARGAIYSRQLEMAFKGKFDPINGKKLDDAIRMEFSADGVTAFIYLLIDPRTLEGIETPNLRQFVEAIFYVGKGTNARPLAHLLDARKMREIKSPKMETNAKLRRINSIWKSGRGIGMMQICHMIGDREAFVREAAFIEAIRLENLTNIKGGQWNGSTKEWDASNRAELGVYLINQAHGLMCTMGLREVHSESLPESGHPFVTTRRR